MPKRTLALGAAAALLGLVAVVLFLPEELIRDGRSLLGELWTQLRNYPILLYLLIVILPAFFVPQSPFVVLAGIVYAEFFGEIVGAAVAATAVGLNILWTYFLTVGPLHAIVSRLLARFGYRIPRLPPEDMLKFSFLLRVTPVIPMCVQNYTLGLLHVPLRKYLLASWATQLPIAFAIALTAGAILEGKVGFILLAVMILLVLVLGFGLLRKKLRRDANMAAMSDELAAETTGAPRREEAL